jgi:uncharacterized protein (TIGR02145 family)
MGFPAECGFRICLDTVPGRESSGYGPPVHRQGVCPSGWRVATDFDWMSMEAVVEKMAWTRPDASPGTSCLRRKGWPEGDSGLDLAGIGLLPGGYRDENGKFRDGGLEGQWWERG